MALTKAQLVDLNANELIVDLDADTSITADTDDQIDIKIAGADDFRFTANTFTALSGSSIVTPTLTVSSSATISGGAINVAAIDLDGATDIGAAIADADLFLVDDGAGGTMRKTTASRVKTYMGAATGEFSVTNLDIDGSTDIGADLADADLFIVDDGAGGTNRKTAASRIKTYIADVTLTTAAQTNITSLGTLTTLTVDDITINGSTISDSGDFTIDGGGDIIIDADGADVIFKDDGTEFGRITNSSTDFVIQTAVSDKDFVIKGNDGGSTITPFTLDMSAGGDLFLTGGLIDLKNDGSAVSQIKFYCESSNAHAQTLIGAPHSESASNTLTLPSSGGDAKLVSVSSTATLTNKTLTTPIITEIDSGSTITLDATTDIILDADGGDVIIKDDGTTIGTFSNTSNDFVITAGVQDKDIIFKGDDGGSTVTPLTLDMSNAGAAIFGAAAYNAEATLTDASTISWNAITQPVAKVTLGGNRTLGAASGGVAGAFISLLIIQDGTGSRTVSFNAAYEFASDTAPTLTTTASKGDLFVFRYNGSKWLEVGRNLALTLS